MNALGATGTVHVAAGTFVEQLDIAKDITLTGQGAATVIQAPARLAVNYNYNGTDNRAIVFIHDTAKAMIQNLTVDGAGHGNGNYRFLGVSFYHAGGRAMSLTVQGVRLTPLDGTQSGIGIYAENRGETTQRNVEVNGCQFSDCQKGAMTFNGNVVANVHDNTITGAGPTGLLAQTAIQVGYGASGTVANNNVSGFVYTGADFATGVLVWQAGATISANVMPNNQKAVAVTAPTTAMGPVSQNNFASSQIGLTCTADGSVNAVNNWWGDPSGPSHPSNPSGTGVAVSDNVVFSPWLGAAPLAKK